MPIVHTLKAATNTVTPMNRSEDLTLSSTGGLELRNSFDAVILFSSVQYFSRKGTECRQRYFVRIFGMNWGKARSANLSFISPHLRNLVTAIQATL